MIDTPHAMQVVHQSSRSRAFIQGVATKFSSFNAERVDAFKAVVNLLKTQPHSRLKNALIKQEGYASRLASAESWDEWLSSKTALGKMVDMWADYTSGHTNFRVFLSRMTPQLVDDAGQQALAVLTSGEAHVVGSGEDNVGPQALYCGASLAAVAVAPHHPLGYLGVATHCLPTASAMGVIKPSDFNRYEVRNYIYDLHVVNYSYSSVASPTPITFRLPVDSEFFEYQREIDEILRNHSPFAAINASHFNGVFDGESEKASRLFLELENLGYIFLGRGSNFVSWNNIIGPFDYPISINSDFFRYQYDVNQLLMSRVASGMPVTTDDLTFINESTNRDELLMLLMAEGYVTAGENDTFQAVESPVPITFRLPVDSEFFEYQREIDAILRNHPPRASITSSHFDGVFDGDSEKASRLFLELKNLGYIFLGRGSNFVSWNNIIGPFDYPISINSDFFRYQYEINQVLTNVAESGRELTADDWSFLPQHLSVDDLMNKLVGYGYGYVNRTERDDLARLLSAEQQVALNLFLDQQSNSLIGPRDLKDALDMSDSEWAAHGTVILQALTEGGALGNFGHDSRYKIVLPSNQWLIHSDDIWAYLVANNIIIAHGMIDRKQVLNTRHRQAFIDWYQSKKGTVSQAEVLWELLDRRSEFAEICTNMAGSIGASDEDGSVSWPSFLALALSVPALVISALALRSAKQSAQLPPALELTEDDFSDQKTSD